MSQSVKIEFVALSSLAEPPQAEARKPAGQTKGPQSLVIFTGPDFKFGDETSKLIGADGEALVRKAAAAGKFKGKASTALDVIAPAGFKADRLLVVGTPGPQAEASDQKAKAEIKAEGAQNPVDYANLGGFVLGKLGRGSIATIVFDPPSAPDNPAAAAAEFALGAQLREYRFDRYKTKKKDEDENGPSEIVLAVPDPAAARAEAKRREAVAEGVLAARS